MRTRVWLSHQSRLAKFIMTGLLVGVLYLFVFGANAKMAKSFDEATWLRAKWDHKHHELNPDQMRQITSDNDIDFFWSHHLKPILIERIPGTKNHELVRKHIMSRMRALSAGWHIELDTFVDKPPHPYKEVEFSSIIATLNPNAKRKLSIVCHYESKIMDDGVFLAATDSAVPCAMMMNMAKVLDQQLKKAKLNDELTVQLIFLDGEEAFVQWTDTDSIYGARHLADKWQHTPYPYSHSTTNVLDSIDCFVLLDLLGGPNPQFQDHFTETSAQHRHMRSIESRLHKMDELESHRHVNQYFTTNRNYAGRISDDHIPFLRRNVRVMHWIATPFPRVWHTLDDNEENLHRPTISNLCKILNVFVAEYMHLEL